MDKDLLNTEQRTSRSYEDNNPNTVHGHTSLTVYELRPNIIRSDCTSGQRFLTADDQRRGISYPEEKASFRDIKFIIVQSHGGRLSAERRRIFWAAHCLLNS